MSNILSIDYGEKRIGLAISLKNTSFAVPFDTLINDRNIFLLLKNIVQDENISLVIIGYPLTVENYVSERHILIKRFADNLKSKINVDVIFEDESYSTIISNKIQKDFNLKNNQIAKNKDAISAQLILERYLMKIRT